LHYKNEGLKCAFGEKTVIIEQKSSAADIFHLRIKNAQETILRSEAAKKFFVRIKFMRKPYFTRILLPFNRQTRGLRRIDLTCFA